MGSYNWTWAGAEFLAVTLVITFVVSRILLLLTKRLSDNYARILIANGLSLVLCGIVYGKLPGSVYDFHYFPDVMSAILDFSVPQGVWFLVDTILEIRRHLRTGLRA
jgi:asparagine N-glycosylation enzyme membrane subunit Stt3